MNKKAKALLIILILIGFIFGIKRAWMKNDFEKDNRKVDLVMSLEEVKILAGRNGMPLSTALSKLRNEAGITSLAVSENALVDLAKKGSLSYYLGSDILRNVRMGNDTVFVDAINKKGFDPGNIYIVFGSKSIKEQVVKSFLLVLKKNQLKLIKNNILVVYGDEAEITSIGTGITQEEINLCKKYGFGLIPRFKDSDRFNENFLRAKFNEAKKINIISSIIFGGKIIPGFPKNLNLTAKAFKDYDLNFGFVEFAEQEGDKILYESLPKNSLRTHSISSEEMEEYSPKKIFDRLLRAVKERQVKLLVIHPILTYDSNHNLFNANLEDIKELTTNLSKLGYHFEKVDKVNYKNTNYLSLIEILIFLLAINSAFVLLIDAMGFKKQLLIWPVFLLIPIALFSFKITGYLILLRKLAALLSAIIFPTLAIISVFKIDDKNKKTIIKAISYVTVLFSITFIGAMIVTGLLADEYFLSGSQRFGGVKIAFLFPLIILTAYYFLLNMKEKSYYLTIKKLLLAPLLKGEIALCLFLFLFLGIYILRSGNYIVLPIWGIEERFRDLLDNLLFVRPRTKEIFIGIPFLFLTYLYYPAKIKKTFLWAFQCLGMIGLISLINTFCHLHSPIYISLIRSVNGLVVGLMIGFIYMFVIETYFYLERIYNK